MGSCQLLTLRSLAQFPAEPPAGREAANIWRTFMREWLQSRDPGRERCTCTHVGPVFLGLSCSPSSQGPSPSPEPSQPTGLQPSEPWSLAASPRQRAPSICRKTPPFSVPLEHPQASASCPTPLLSMKNRGQDRSGAEPNSKPVPRPGVTRTDSGTAAPTLAQRDPDPAQCSAWPGGGRG